MPDHHPGAADRPGPFPDPSSRVGHSRPGRTRIGSHSVDRNEPADHGTVDRLDLENLGKDDAADLLEHLIGTEADYRS